MPRRFRISPRYAKEFHNGRHRFEHWYRDNTVYFLTARTREGFPAFNSEQAKSVFWDRFNHYTQSFGFTPWVTSLLSNHYHTLGYLKTGENLGPMIQRLHGSVAKLVNDLLPERRVPFWRDSGRNDYFDGCIRNEKQCRKAYRYTLTQCSRHRLCPNWRDYLHTHAPIEVDRGVHRALQLRAFMDDVPYPRYTRPKNSDPADWSLIASPESRGSHRHRSRAAAGSSPAPASGKRLGPSRGAGELSPHHRALPASSRRFRPASRTHHR